MERNTGWKDGKLYAILVSGGRIVCGIFCLRMCGEDRVFAVWSGTGAPEELTAYRIPLMDVKVREPISLRMPLVIDFGFTNTTAGVYLDSLYFSQAAVDLSNACYVDEGFSIFYGKVSILLPEGFIDMPSEIARIKYPSEQRSQEIMTSDDGTVNFTFSLFEADFNEGQLYYFIFSKSSMPCLHQGQIKSGGSSSPS